MTGHSNGFLIIVVLLAFLVGYSVVVSLSNWRNKDRPPRSRPGEDESLGVESQETPQSQSDKDVEIDRLRGMVRELVVENEKLKRAADEKADE